MAHEHTLSETQLHEHEQNVSTAPHDSDGNHSALESDGSEAAVQSDDSSAAVNSAAQSVGGGAAARSAVLESTPEPVPRKRGRPKGAKDTHKRIRAPIKTHTPSKAYVENDSTVHDFHEAMRRAQEQEILWINDLYKSWLPY